jgi:hypothetical protein
MFGPRKIRQPCRVTRLFWVGFFENYTITHIIGQLISTAKFRFKFWQKSGLGYILGDFFYKRIWSPWILRVSNELSTRISNVMPAAIRPLSRTERRPRGSPSGN